MASQLTKIHDPMYNFDTHFPERFSRLHLHGDFNSSGSFHKKTSRTQRCGARYKTQPVTFDEIKEVDEEPLASSGTEKMETREQQLKDHLQPLSRSMDVLITKGLNVERTDELPQLLSRSGSRKYKKNRACIPEHVGLEQQQLQSPTGEFESKQKRLQGEIKIVEEKSDNKEATNLKPADAVKEDISGTHIPLVPSPNIGCRRHKVTAKAKKRQKAEGDGEAS